MFSEVLEVVAAHPGRCVTGDCAEDCAAGGGPDEESATDCREREECNNQTGRQSHPAAEYSADARGRLMLFDDLGLASIVVLDDGGVIAIDQSSFRVKFLYELIVSLGVSDAVIHANVCNQRVDRHPSSLSKLGK